MTDALTKSIRELLQVEAGKRFVFHVLEESAIYRDAYSGDDAATNYVLGQQSIGRRLIARIDAIDARLYPRLLLDMADIRETDKAEADALSANSEEDDG